MKTETLFLWLTVSDFLRVFAYSFGACMMAWVMLRSQVEASEATDDRSRRLAVLAMALAAPMAAEWAMHMLDRLHWAIGNMVGASGGIAAKQAYNSLVGLPHLWVTAITVLISIAIAVQVRQIFGSWQMVWQSRAVRVSLGIASLLTAAMVATGFFVGAHIQPGG